MTPDVIGRMKFMHKFDLYVHSVLEWLLQHLEELFDSIGILSTGHLPPILFPPTALKNITTHAINSVHKLHPDYVLAIDHVTAYYDMKLVTFGVDHENNMIIAFPIFVKDHNSKPKTLYEIEDCKSPHT